LVFAENTLLIKVEAQLASLLASGYKTAELLFCSDSRPKSERHGKESPLISISIGNSSPFVPRYRRTNSALPGIYAVVVRYLTTNGRFHDWQWKV
jgi:hypothetical protein